METETETEMETETKTEWREVSRDTDLEGDLRYTLYWKRTGTPKEQRRRIGMAAVCPANRYNHGKGIRPDVRAAFLYTIVINKRHRERGHGIWFLRWIMKDLYENESTRYLVLHDFSDRCGRDDSIYRKAGFVYTSDDGEMIGNLRHIHS